jgi:hypothetical protein
MTSADLPFIDPFHPPPQFPALLNAPRGYWKWLDFHEGVGVTGTGTFFDPYEVEVTAARSVVVADEGVQDTFEEACEWFCGGGLTFKAGLSALTRAGLKGAAKEAVERSVWKLPWATRGFTIEEQLGANLPQKFPVIDKFTGGVATSIKSVDLTAASYQNVGTLTNRLNSFVD